ncbi:MAG: hypothetical protein PVJ27_02255, partial [Candidatus Brocadiaceae bacterium]
RGFLFRYFDRILCGVVAVGLLACIAYAVKRAASLPEQIRPNKISNDLQVLQRKKETPPPAVREPQLAEKIAQSLRQAPTPRPVRDPMLPPLPVVYPAQTVGRDMTFELNFAAPLAPGSVEVEGNEFLVEVLEHPLDEDYSSIRLKSSRSFDGKVSVVGIAGDVKHIHPVVVDKEVGKTPYPPVEITVRKQVGSVVLAFKPHPNVAEEGVQVRSYEVWRRDWSDPTGDYRLVAYASAEPGRAATGTPEKKAAERGRRAAPSGAPSGEAFMPPEVQEMLRRMGQRVPSGAPEAPAPPEEEVTAAEGQILWWDRDVTPGRKYGYKFRTVGQNTYPAKGDFTEPVTVPVWPNIDFRVSFTGTDSVRFEVVKLDAQTGRIRRESFWVALGDEIGGTVRDRSTGARTDFLTGCTLVDFQAQAPNPVTGGRSARVTYADQSGVLHQLYRDQIRAEELWERARAARRAGGRRR